MSELNALVGIDFSLIGTKLHAAYEKDKDGYSVLLMPAPQEADNGVTIGKLIEDIRGLVNGVRDKELTDEEKQAMEADLQDGLSGLTPEDDKKDGFDLNKLIIKLNMAYLYIRKTQDEATSTLEYAFQLEVIAKDLIPEAVRSLVTVDCLSISVWNTTRQKVLDKMSLVSINDYIGIADTAE